MVTRALFALVVALSFSATLARAQEREPPAPRIHHAPRAVASADASLEVGATIDRPHLVKRALLVYRNAANEPLHEVPFQRAARGDTPWVAIVPAADVKAPSLSYAIEIETLDGARSPAFASREDMHAVEILGDIQDAREAAQLERLQGRRSTVAASGEYVYFGDVASPSGGVVRDAYWRSEASYTYRILRTVSEFGIRAGVVRGTSLVPNGTGNDVGLNYGAPRVRLRAEDWLHFDGEFLTSVTEVGFSVGAGGAMLLGDPYGTKLTLGFETIQVFGSRGYTRFDLVASRRLVVAPIVEVTNMPHAGATGVRLLGEAIVDLGSGFALAARGGYQARTFAGGGPSAGASALYSF